MANAKRPLDGIRVLDFSTLLPGPLATLLLAEAGADVIKVERPDGDDMRSYAPRWGADSAAFALLNRGKRSLVANLKDPAGRDRVMKLAREADVIVEQFRPGVLERLGLSRTAVAQTNPRIIYCSITGYGQTGAFRSRAGHDLNYLGDAGVLALSHGETGHRVIPPVAIADIAGGAYPAVMNIMFALRQRDKTGEGTHLDIAMTDSLFTMAYLPLASGLVADTWAKNGESLVTGGSPRYALYDTHDGQVLAVAALEQKFWDAFTQVIGLEQHFADDVKNPNATRQRVAEIIATRNATEWERVLATSDCCCSIVRDLRHAMTAERFRERGLFDYMLENEDRVILPALPVPVASCFRGSPGAPLTAPPLGDGGEDLEWNDRDQ